MRIFEPQIAKMSKPGQFVNLYTKDNMKLLPRPISICDIEKNGIIKLVYAVIGAGTKEFSKYKPDESIRIFGPLGTGFDISLNKNDEVKNFILLGGGLGNAPLLFLAKRIREKYKRNCNINTILGFSNDSFLIKEFEKYSDNIILAFENQSFFEKYSGKTHPEKSIIKTVLGNSMDGLKKIKLDKNSKKSVHSIFTCGPIPMMKAVIEFGIKNNISVQASLEARMGCGYGACKGCSQIVAGKIKKVCIDGLVFKGDEIEWGKL